MILSAKQINQLHAMLQEYPDATHVDLRVNAQDSAIGSYVYADYYKNDYSRYRAILLGTIEITDMDMW